MFQRSTIEEWEAMLSYIRNCSDIEEVMSMIHERMIFLGFEKSAYWLRWSNDPTKAPILFTTYPREFVDHYVENDYAAHDMVGTLSTNSNRPFGWNEIGKKFKITRKQKMIFHDSKSVGLNEGASVPIHGPKLMKATFSVSSNLPKKEFDELFKFHQHEIHILAVAAHEKMIELGLGQETQSRELSTRETEVILWIARGLTYSEIADKLFIQEDTVKKHMQSIFEKLNATNGPHAASVAIISGLITP